MKQSSYIMLHIGQEFPWKNTTLNLTYINCEEDCVFKTREATRSRSLSKSLSSLHDACKLSLKQHAQLWPLSVVWVLLKHTEPRLIYLPVATLSTCCFISKLKEFIRCVGSSLGEFTDIHSIKRCGLFGVCSQWRHFCLLPLTIVLKLGLMPHCVHRPNSWVFPVKFTE